ncbi:hypothetical protein PhCBS80983_g02142 [Powellomyces hirtus]|uniref:25S rRNA (uridine-N(3))-methyltransferase BMT5-like domain-containing protein n=1 Tax=Powellomyces hirtus TaxID=109895 RepID=A0A507E839_9FUNG|nr:hypothetical protein PhCBS80983_g02142 [Powellomyces hirtus]
MKGKKLKTALQSQQGLGNLKKALGKELKYVKPSKPKQTHKKRPSVFPFDEWDNILFVGEGNFSFAHAVLEKLHGACTVCATAFDSEETTLEKYPDASEHIEAITELGGSVHFQVDATSLQSWKAGRRKEFSKIVFNFPHVGAGLKDQDRNIRANQALVFNFLSSACTKMAADGQIHVTLKNGIPYDLWDIKEQAKRTQLLKCIRSFEFDPALYPEYSHRRTIGFLEGLSTNANEEISRLGSRTYAFGHSSVPGDTSVDETALNGSDSE